MNWLIDATAVHHKKIAVLHKQQIDALHCMERIVAT